MLKRVSIFFIVNLFFFTAGFAQKSASYNADIAQYQKALSLYKNRKFSVAQQLFKKLNQQTGERDIQRKTAYYAAISGVYLQQPDAEKDLISFVHQYPESAKRNSAFTHVANFYFERGQYAMAQKWYEKVDPQSLSLDQQKKYNFNRGYAAFKTDDPESAQTYFNRVENDEKYGSQAKYYLGYMAYEGDDYKTAKGLFEEVDQEDQEDKKVSYFQSNISFKSGDFEKAIEQAKTQLPKSNRQEKSELNKIIGESYFNLKKYEEAIPYLEKYEGKQGRWNNTDYYQLGYAYYKQKKYRKAISQFNKIVDGHDSVAQNAYYHLAESYINLDRKQEALNAFKNASEMDFDQDIKEDAALNYAKLSYDIGNSYKSIPEVLTEFLDHYPNSSAKGEVQELLVNSYITSKNYKKAMQLLENSRSFKDKEVYQKVAFYRGIELYDQEDYQSAKKAFEKSIAQHSVARYTARATYWKAESDYNLENYKEALIGYKAFQGMSGASQTKAYEDIDYNIGYAYFNQKDYKNAADHFKAYVESGRIDAKQKNDGFLRLGDSYFASSEYWKAMEEYNKAIAQKGVDNDYAYFQKAISYGFVDRNERKIEDLNAFLEKYPNSMYRDDALYQLGNTYMAENKHQEALKSYKKIAESMPHSHYLAKAILKQGLIYYNNDQNQKALEKLKKVAVDFPNSEEANQAVKSARNIYVDLGKTDEYAQWVKSLDYVNVSDSDIDDATYESADNQLVNGADEKAIKSFKKYLNKFGNGGHALSAHYHLAQLLYKNEDYSGAEPHYSYVIEKPRGEYTEKSLKRLARIYLEADNNEKAIPILKRLEDGAKLQKNVTFALSNLMKAYYEQDDYKKTVNYATKVLADHKAGDRAKNDAQIFVARSAMKTGDEKKAKQAYREVAKKASGELAAEAQYYDAYFKRKAENYEASNKSVQVLAKEYSSYREYSVKGLLLMGKNFYDLGDAYQATYILQNVIDNFEDYPKVTEQAKTKLKRIKTEEAKTNSSVNDHSKPQKDSSSTEIDDQ